MDWDKFPEEINLGNSMLTLEVLEKILVVLNQEGQINIRGVLKGSTSLFDIATKLYVHGMNLTETGKP